MGGAGRRSNYAEASNLRFDCRWMIMSGEPDFGATCFICRLGKDEKRPSFETVGTVLNKIPLKNVNRKEANI